MTLDNILEEIKKAETIVILTHDLPDGDAVGLPETEGMTVSLSIAPYSDDRRSSLSVSPSIPFPALNLPSASLHTVS